MIGGKGGPGRPETQYIVEIHAFENNFLRDLAVRISRFLQWDRRLRNSDLEQRDVSRFVRCVIGKSP